MKAKDLSLAGKILATIFVLILFILKLIFKWEIDTWDIIQVGLFVFLIYAPIDISKILEKFGRR